MLPSFGGWGGGGPFLYNWEKSVGENNETVIHNIKKSFVINLLGFVSLKFWFDLLQGMIFIKLEEYLHEWLTIYIVEPKIAWFRSKCSEDPKGFEWKIKVYCFKCVWTCWLKLLVIHAVPCNKWYQSLSMWMENCHCYMVMFLQWLLLNCVHWN